MLKAKLSLVVAALALANVPAHAVDERTKEQLLKIEPTSRLEQACDIEIMAQINKKNPQFRVDKVIAYTVSDPTYKADFISAPGAVFRSHGEWYYLSYTCRTGPRHINVRGAAYEIGGKIDHKDWKTYSLYD